MGQRRTRGPRWVMPIVVTLSLLISGCTDSEDTDAETASCTPFEKPTTVAQLNEQIQAARSSPRFRGADVGASAELADGRSLWVFGDSLRGAEYGNRIVRNSMLLFDTDCIRAVAGAGNGAVIPDRDDEVGYWPMSIAVLPGDGNERIAVLAQRVSGSDAAWGFHNLGPALAMFTIEPGGDPKLESVQDIGPDNPARTNPAWGAATWIQDGYVYLYGTSNPGDGSAFGYALQVARVPVDELSEPTSWTYWDGVQWSADPSTAQVLIGAVGGVSQTLSVIFKDDRWYVVTKRDDFLGQDLVVWSADAPTGPFTVHAPVASIPSDTENHLFIYMPLAHPEIFTQPGSLVVSYSQNTDDLAKLADHPSLYRPVFMTITLPT